MIRVLTVASVALGVSPAAWSQINLPVSVNITFGGVDTRSEIPTMNSRFSDRMVHFTETNEGEVRIEFLGEYGGKELSLPSHTASQFSVVEFDEGSQQAKFTFEEPLRYRFLRADELSGKVEIVSGQIKTIVARISDENLEGFKRIYFGFPTTGYVNKSHMETISHMAELYRSESPDLLSEHPDKEFVPGLEIRGRQGLSSFARLQTPISDLPEILFPVNIPLHIEINPITEQVVSGQTEVRGSPEYRVIGVIDGDTVGLEGSGSRFAGGPSGFMSVLEMVPVDLHDTKIRSFIAARSEVIGMRNRIESAYKKLNGIPTFAFEADPKKGVTRILLVNGSTGDDSGYQGIHQISDCSSLLDGRTF